jgi:predicted enzyme related to lactoylglutathione lyase
MCNLRGRRVAGIGSPVPVEGHDPVWGIHITVDDVDETIAKGTEAGGKVAMEPFEALDGGRMALLVDPTGGVFMAWRNGENNGAQLVNEPGAWSMSALHTRDTQAAAEYYGAVLGWSTETFDMGDGELTIFRLPGFVGGEPSQPVSRETVAVMREMSAKDFPEDVPPHWHCDFWVADCDGTAVKAKELGGNLIAEPFDTPPFRSAVIRDPQGATFSISQLVAG